MGNLNVNCRNPSTENLHYIFLPFNNYPNKNGRIYNKESFTNFNQILQRVEDGQCFGEVALTNLPAYTPIIELDKISHIITSIEITEVGLEGTITILDTPRGKLMEHMLDSVVIRPKMYLSEQDESGIVKVRIESFDFISKQYDGFNYNKRVQLSKLKKNIES